MALQYNNIFLYQNPELPLEERLNDLINRFTLEEKIKLITVHQHAVERLGVKEFHIGREAAHGLSGIGEKATVFPQPIGLACTWDKSLLYSIGNAIGDEARAYYKKSGENRGLNLWTPTVDMERDPRWGRTEEGYGEDPYLTGELSTALIRGMQGSHKFYLKVAATLKHFFGNNNEENRSSCSVSIDQRNMREYYLKPFKAGIENGGATSIMAAYNAVNGKPGVVNPLLKDLVKNQWKMSGFVVSDQAALSQAITKHKYNSSVSLVVAEAIKSGVDCFIEDEELVYDAVREAIVKQFISEDDLNNAIKNVFRIRFRLGHFDPPELNPYSKIGEDVICCPKHSQLALKAARESIVLLKNSNNILPVNKGAIKKLAIIGPLANTVYTDFYGGVLPYAITPLQGVMEKMKGTNVVFRDGCDLVTFKSLKSGKYVAVDGENNNYLKADSDKVTEEAQFILNDWGWGSFTLKSDYTYKHVKTGNKESSWGSSYSDNWNSCSLSNETNCNDSKGSDDECENKLWAVSDNPSGWFVTEVFNIINGEENTCTIETWNGLVVCPSEDKEMILEGHYKDDFLDIATERFKKDTIINGIEEAAKAAEEADTAIVFVGNNPYINGKEDVDRPGLSLPKAQEELIEEVYKANKNTIVVIIGSYPFAIDSIYKYIPAIIYSSHGGQELGKALADVIFGDYSPSGKLNMTWYSGKTKLPNKLDYDIINGKRTYMYFDGVPLFPFGHGLTYASFSYSNLKIKPKTVSDDGFADISLDIENTGTVAGDEVVQLYVGIKSSAVKRPYKELKGFLRLNLLPGAKERVSFTLSAKDLEFWDVIRDKYCVESGLYNIYIGSSSDDIRVSGTIELKEDKNRQ